MGLIIVGGDEASRLIAHALDGLLVEENVYYGVFWEVAYFCRLTEALTNYKNLLINRLRRDSLLILRIS